MSARTKHLTCLVSILILAFSTIAIAADPVAWWKMDDEATGNVVDSSGNNYHGTMIGTAVFVPGYIDGAVQTTGGNGAVVFEGYKGILGANPISITAWLSTTDGGQILGWGTSSKGEKIEFRINNDKLQADNGNNPRFVAGSTEVTDGEWHHVAVTVKAGAGAQYPDMILYLDGEDDTDPTQGNHGQAFNIQANYDVTLGRRHNNPDQRKLNAFYDDVRVYDVELSQDEIKVLAGKFDSYKPFPANGGASAETTLVMQWSPGAIAAESHLFFGTEADVVARSATADKGIMTSDFYLATDLVPGQRYYWRVDSIDQANPDSPWPGEVWNFKISSLIAEEPSPADGANYIMLDKVLTWSPGLDVLLQEVYFGTDFDAVNNADQATPDVYKGIVAQNTYTPTLAQDITYYWRVDTINGSGQELKGDVWSFTTMPPIPIPDPNLLAWWKMDEADGEILVDWSGHAAHAFLRNDPNRVPGWVGNGAIELDGIDDYAAIDGLFYDGNDYTQVSVATWIKAENSSDTQKIISFDHSEFWRLAINQGAGAGEIDWGFDSTDAGPGRIGSTMRIDDDQWHHVVGTFENGNIRLYIDGKLDGWTVVGTKFGTSNMRYGFIGAGSEASSFDGNKGTADYANATFDDMRVYDKAITLADIQLVMRGDPDMAWAPSPANFSTPTIDEFSNLSWSPGDSATMHDVYLGADAAAVAAATTDDHMGVYAGRQALTSYSTGDLPMGQTYYWRIDEFNNDGSITTGRIWTFVVAPYLLIDDFESYGVLNDPGQPGARVWFTWADGFGYSNPTSNPGNATGSMVDLGIANSGDNGLTIDYDNTGTFINIEGATVPAHHSLVTANAVDLAAGTNWTRNSIAAMAMSFRGYPGAVGNFTDLGGTYEITAAGADIWETADEFHFAFVEKTLGVYTVIAKVESVENVHNWTKAGIMIRDSLAPGSPHAQVVVTPGQGVAFQRRNTLDATSQGDTIAGITAPQWIKLERDFAGVCTGYYSDNGTAWTQIGEPNTLTVSGSMYIGLVLTSHTEFTPATAVFSNVTIQGAPVTGWQSKDIGITSNQAEPLYVQIEDTSGTKFQVINDDPNAVLNGDWQQWDIPLTDFAGVNLSSVKAVSIGVGLPGSPPGTKGRIHVDDFRLYPPRCRTEVQKPAASFNDDCVVNLADADIMFADWLATGYDVTVETASDANLEAHFMFENNTLDSSGNLRHGDVNGVAAYTPGITGQALNLDGGTHVVLTGYKGVTGAASRTMAAWINATATGDIISYGTNTASLKWVMRLDTEFVTGALRVEIAGTLSKTAATSLLDDQWHHVAVVLDSDGTPETGDMQLFVDGLRDATHTLNNGPINTNTDVDVIIGAETWNNRPITGLIDDVRIYSRALSAGEVANLAGMSAGSVVSQPVQALLSTAGNTDLNPDDVIDFKDAAVLLDSWLDELLWP